MLSKACLAGSRKQKNILKLNSARDVEILTAELMFKNSLLQINHKCAPFWSFYPGKKAKITVPTGRFHLVIQDGKEHQSQMTTGIRKSVDGGS